MDTPKLIQLQEKYRKALTEEEKIDVLSDITLEIRTEDVERALVLADEIMERSEKIGYAKGIGNAYNHKGACFWIKGEYEDGLDELAEAYSIAREINDQSLEAKALNNYGRIYRELGDISNALVHFEEALEINESLGDVINQSINLTNIANLYLDLADYDPALEYALKCLPIFEKDDDKVRLTSIYNTLGNIYFKKELFPQALDYFKRTQNLTDDNTPAKALANSGVGKVYFKMNDYEKASYFLNIALEQAQEFANVECEILSEYYLGCMYKEQSLFSKSLAYFERSLYLAEEFLRRQDILGIHEKMSQLFDELNDVPKAYEHMKAYEKLKEEIFHQNTYNKLRNLQIKNKIEVAKKEKEVAERTAALKQQFMANMSHEIRTPMNAIVGITRLLLDKQPTEEQKKYLNVIQQSADNLLVIINDILDLSKIEANKIIIEHIDFSVRDLVNSTREMMALKAEEKHLGFEVTIAEDIPDRLVGDPTRLNQILVNLVGNAIKFTEKGDVQIKLTTSAVKNDKIHIRFDISDTGIGISKQYTNSIFESFTQAGSDTARKFGGTGLGLTISKQLVDMMKGRIEVESELDHGTVFSVYLPFGIAAVQTPVKKENLVTEEMKSALNRSRILLVEDNEFNRIVAVETLKSLLPDIKIDIAEHGDIAIEKLQQRDYDLILMDIQMPVRDGISTTRYIRKEMPEPKKHTRIIAMTANVLQEDVKTYFKEGMDAYISKPFQTEELLLKMSHQLENRALVAQQESQAPKESENSASKKLHLPDQVTDMQFLKQFTGGNVEKRNKYISMFLDNCPKLINQINQALDHKDYPVMKIAAHSLKPQMSYMGIKEEVSNIYLIEHAAAEAQQEVLPTLIKHLNKVCTLAFTELQAILQA
ncbi:hypothetical protein DBR32_07155 [Taibaiella sp. KBW10]|uniref:tetratricopeptide repeat protein n=1 Tax=Taibaiella sp. KBW10 TaxID=2153357 RepID=UPI000F5A0131|nr:tetratricopeptide repeat protein [Taibaiella sp. KBW10]RQO31716.1 hypothetical protein DBR32_07155 [Taibaiella sp. KBW10]